MSDSNDSGTSKQSDATSTFDTPPAEPIVPSGEQLVYEEYVDLEGRPELLVVIVEAVAETRDESVSALIPIIGDAIDTDGLKNVFRDHPDAPSRSGWVTFFFCGCRIILDSDHRLRIYDRLPATDTHNP